MKLQRSGEDYLEAIYVLKKEKGTVRSIDVAHHLDYSKPSVSRAVNNLKADGYLEVHDGGELVLTEKGLDVAKNIYERHTILTDLFCSLGVSRKTALEDACLVEHAISEETFARLKATHADRLGAAAAPLAGGALAHGGAQPAAEAAGTADAKTEGKADKADKDKKKKKKKKGKS